MHFKPMHAPSGTSAALALILHVFAITVERDKSFPLGLKKTCLKDY